MNYLKNGTDTTLAGKRVSGTAYFPAGVMAMDALPSGEYTLTGEYGTDADTGTKLYATTTAGVYLEAGAWTAIVSAVVPSVIDWLKAGEYRTAIVVTAVLILMIILFGRKK